jgi:hypothetical protein
MREVAIPKRSPIAEQTPKACISTKSRKRFISNKLNYQLNTAKGMYCKITKNV